MRAHRSRKQAPRNSNDVSTTDDEEAGPNDDEPAVNHNQAGNRAANGRPPSPRQPSVEPLPLPEEPATIEDVALQYLTDVLLVVPDVQAAYAEQLIRK